MKKAAFLCQISFFVSIIILTLLFQLPKTRLASGFDGGFGGYMSTGYMATGYMSTAAQGLSMIVTDPIGTVGGPGMSPPFTSPESVINQYRYGTDITGATAYDVVTGTAIYGIKLAIFPDWDLGSFFSPVATEYFRKASQNLWMTNFTYPSQQESKTSFKPIEDQVKYTPFPRSPWDWEQPYPIPWQYNQVSPQGLQNVWTGVGQTSIGGAAYPISSGYPLYSPSWNISYPYIDY